MPALTVTQIKAAKSTIGKDKFMADGGGLFLKIAAAKAKAATSGDTGDREAATKSFVFRYTYGSRRRLMTLGTYPELELAEARQKHLEARRTLESGVDPLQVNQAAKQALKAALTVEQLGDEWLTRVIDKQFKKPEEVRRMLAVDIYPRIGKFLAKDITSREAALVVNKVVDRGSPVQANRVLRTLKKLFAYAVEQSHIAINPVTMTINGAGGKEESRDRNLSLGEIRAVLKEFETTESKTSWQVRNIIKLLLLTVQRPGEVCAMQWKHVNLDAGIWTLPKEITKSERAHIVHLSAQTVAILKEIQPLTGDNRYVFTSEKDDKRHIETRSLSQAVRKRIAGSDLRDMEPFTPHDLRRTATSRMADMSVAPHVLEKIQSHVMTGVMGVYNRADYFAERKEALALWGDRIEQLMSNDENGNVVFLKGRAA
ncbi:tyrosine-type recombinase/integrase [Collimonas antrihumi]|uniref:tyrosine-type recombinase/integrase n=1 Tax=Collimonas antrihumi TaxID=1940615 RepID=UPI001B8A9B1E|nr:site-specific integrase [Collimonas antrihumi]